jgi:long-subunit acyl-CoA synthetase (AMP-forming)
MRSGLFSYFSTLCLRVSVVNELPFFWDKDMAQQEQKITGSTIPENFFNVAGAYPLNTLFHYVRGVWETITYKAFAEEVSATASSLIRMGLEKGDRAAIIAENRPGWCAAYLSVLTAGGIAVPIDSQLGPEEIQNLLSDSGAKIVFHSRMTEAAVKTRPGGCRHCISQWNSLTLIERNYVPPPQLRQVDFPRHPLERSRR